MLEKIVGALMLASLAAMMIAEIARRYLVFRKFRELFPEKAPSWFSSVSLNDVPKNKKGDDFLDYFRKTSRIAMLPLIALCVLIAMFAYLTK